MINPDKMAFVERKGHHPGTRVIRGGLILNVEITVDERHRTVSMDQVKDHIREVVWRDTYGDLVGPIKRLQRLALAYAPPSEIKEADEACAIINDLMRRKTDHKPK